MTITARRFQPADAQAVSRLICRTLQITNAADYSAQELDEVAASLSPEKLLWRATWMHFYVFCHGETIVGCGAVGPYWDQIDECSFFNIFVLPEYQGRGVGSKIIETLEKDELFLRSKRAEIPASLTAVHFYRKFGYEYKNGITTPDEEKLYRLEKYRNQPQTEIYRSILMLRTNNE